MNGALFRPLLRACTATGALGVHQASGLAPRTRALRISSPALGSAAGREVAKLLEPKIKELEETCLEPKAVKNFLANTNLRLLKTSDGIAVLEGEVGCRLVRLEWGEEEASSSSESETKRDTEKKKENEVRDFGDLEDCNFDRDTDVSIIVRDKMTAHGLIFWFRPAFGERYIESVQVFETEKERHHNDFIEFWCDLDIEVQSALLDYIVNMGIFDTINGFLDAVDADKPGSTHFARNRKCRKRLQWFHKVKKFLDS